MYSFPIPFGSKRLFCRFKLHFTQILDLSECKGQRKYLPTQKEEEEEKKYKTPNKIKTYSNYFIFLSSAKITLPIQARKAKASSWREELGSPFWCDPETAVLPPALKEVKMC